MSKRKLYSGIGIAVYLFLIMSMLWFDQKEMDKTKFPLEHKQNTEVWYSIRQNDDSPNFTIKLKNLTKGKLYLYSLSGIENIKQISPSRLKSPDPKNYLQTKSLRALPATFRNGGLELDPEFLPSTESLYYQLLYQPADKSEEWWTIEFPPSKKILIPHSSKLRAFVYATKEKR